MQEEFTKSRRLFIYGGTIQTGNQKKNHDNLDTENNILSQI